MATQIKTPAKDLYEADFYVWAQNQAELLRARRFDDLDLANLIEEVDDLGGALRRSTRLRVTMIIQHLLKLQHWPQSGHRLAWRDAVRRERTELLSELTPSLRRYLGDNLRELYAGARHDAEGSLRDHGEDAAAEVLPAASPYSLDPITGDWLP